MLDSMPTGALQSMMIRMARDSFRSCCKLINMKTTNKLILDGVYDSLLKDAASSDDITRQRELCVAISGFSPGGLICCAPFTVPLLGLLEAPERCSRCGHHELVVVSRSEDKMVHMYSESRDTRGLGAQKK